MRTPAAFFTTLAQSRVAHTLEKTFRSFLNPDLLIVGDFGQHSLVSSRPTAMGRLLPDITSPALSSPSNRAVDEWLGRFDDHILDNSALSRLANASYQIVIEGIS